MTFGYNWRPAANPNNRYMDQYPPYGQQSVDRGDTGSYSYGGGGGGEIKWKSKKADKKQAAMSAMTLIAFLFFLNVLQNCLKEEMTEESDHDMTIMMVDGDAEVEGKQPEEQFLERVDLIKDAVKSRRLLSVADEDDHQENPREGRFIHDFGVASRDWSNDLTQVTDEDLHSQKEKVEQLQRLWKKKSPEPSQKLIREKTSMEGDVHKIKVKKFINNPVMSDLRGIPKLSHYWEMQKTTTSLPETKSVDFEEPTKTVADFHDFETYKETAPSLTQEEHALAQTIAQNLNTEERTKNYQTMNRNVIENKVISDDFTEIQQNEVNSEKAAGKISNNELQHRQYGPPIPQSEFSYDELHGLYHPPQPLRADPSAYGEVSPQPTASDDPLNTPRYRRSDVPETTLRPEDLFRPAIQVVTPNPSTEALPTTTKTYHVYTHPSQISSDFWKSTTAKVPAESETRLTTSRFSVDSIYLTTVRPPVPHRISKPFSNHRANYKPATRYKYSPNRRVSFDPPLVRQEYYPMSVVGQYSGDANYGVMNLIWTFITSFARPIARLVPDMSKVSSEARCFDLLACEAHRVGRFMGPTAQAVASTFSTMLMWATSQQDRPLVEAAVAAGKSNSCSKQIVSCDQRSGGKTAMTMVAQLLELPGTESREPRTVKLALANAET